MAIAASAIVVVWCLVLGQLPETSLLSRDRVRVSSSVNPETASPGDSVKLLVEVTPKKDVRLFALGAKDFTPLMLDLDLPGGVSIGKPNYPIPERQSVPGAKKPVPVYDDRVEIEQTIKIGKNVKPGDTLTIDGVLTYQPCDDRITYRRASLPVTFTVRIQ
jgi:DsbC/DsbD-like thiol-disulfide interchange protein